MKTIILFFLFMVQTTIFGQVNMMVVDVTMPIRPFDTISDVTNGRMSVNKLYIAEGNDVNKNKHYFDNDDVTFVNTPNLVDSFETILILDNHSKPTSITFGTNNFKVDFVGRVNYSLNYIPFSVFYVDSIAEYKTVGDFRVELIYTGKLVESVQVHFDRVTDKTYNMAKDWFNTLSTKEKIDMNVNPDNRDEVIVKWIDVTFLSSVSKFFPDKDYTKKLIKNERFSFNFTNKDFYTDFQDKEW